MRQNRWFYRAIQAGLIASLCAVIAIAGRSSLSTSADSSAAVGLPEMSQLRTVDPCGIVGVDCDAEPKDKLPLEFPPQDARPLSNGQAKGGVTETDVVSAESPAVSAAFLVRWSDAAEALSVDMNIAADRPVWLVFVRESVEPRTAPYGVSPEDLASESFVRVVDASSGFGIGLATRLDPDGLVDVRNGRALELPDWFQKGE